MMTHPAIEDVAVVGLPHDQDGERPLAFVVLSDHSKVTAQELIDYTNGKLPQNSQRKKEKVVSKFCVSADFQGKLWKRKNCVAGSDSSRKFHGTIWAKSFVQSS
jgi:acyl-CoA synthetase (AMP-forming)/AMP-acid ligase II